MEQNSGAPLLIHGDQQLVLSAEDAAQLLAQAGIQLGDNEQVIIGDVGEPSAGTTDAAGIVSEDGGDNTALVGAEMLAPQGQQQQLLSGLQQSDQHQNSGDVSDDGTVLYIDPNDPQAAEILQQAGLRLTEEGTVTSLAAPVATKSEAVSSTPPLSMPQLDAPPVVSQPDAAVAIPSAPSLAKTKKSTPGASAQTPQGSNTSSRQVVQVKPDQQQVLYSVTGEDGVTQQYMMLCPKDMDQNVLIQTLVKQISSDPATKGGKKTIKITQQRGAVQKITGLPPGSRVVSQTVNPPSASKTKTSPRKQTVKTPKGAAKKPHMPQQPQQQVSTPQAPPPPLQQQQNVMPSPTPISTNDLFSTMQPISQAALKNVLNQSDVFESVVPDLPLENLEGGTRVYVKCNYCPNFRSTLNGDTWESILNHILPVAKEEIQTSFYGDLSKHFIRSLRIQINGKQMVKRSEREIPQCEVILSHSLICRKTKREFIVSNPDANFVASIAKHIRMTQPGNSGRGNSLLCIFCNSPFTHEDYLRHIQPHLDAILATLNCFAGAYCAHMYTNTMRAQHSCHVCQDSESSDLRFLPCTKFSNDYLCTKKLQFAIDCFREHYGDSGFLRLNTSTVARCSVCKTSQQVYCAVFHISTQILGEDETQHQDVDQQLAVCVNCQKQFINIVMKEQGFDERLKLFQLKNMEQLCSVLRVILNQSSALCDQKKTSIYTVHENTSNPNSAVHIVKSAEIISHSPITKLMSLAESDIQSSKTKAFFVCDLCLFTTDLTALMVEKTDKQKNDMLLSIVLEHLVPHTESLMNVIASTAANQTFHLKYEVMSRVQDMGSYRKIVISLRKKFKSQTSNLEVEIDRDEDKTISQLRTAVKSERKTFVALKSVKAGSVPGSTIVGDSSTAGQLIEVNKFIERQRGKLGILSQSGCNTTLLGSYTECKLCSKFSFPDFRLSAMAPSTLPHSQVDDKPKAIHLCENCVETVLTLCLPTEPECLQESEECLALGEPKNMGHRLVLSNNMKKWLSLDGVNLIKKTIDDYEEAKRVDCSTLFLEGLKRHINAVLKTCQKDDDITCCSAGFCVTDSFLEKEKDSDETAAALASLEQQIGMPIKQKKEQKPREIQVTVLSRKEKTKAPPPKMKTPTIVYPRGFQKRLGLSTPVTTAPVGKLLSTPVTAKSSSSQKKEQQEESVSAIKSFIEATEKEEVKVPSGVKITPAGKGTVNIRAVSDNSPRTVVTTPVSATTTTKSTSSSITSTIDSSSRRSSGRIAKSTSSMTLTANGVVKNLPTTESQSTESEDESEDDKTPVKPSSASATPRAVKRSAPLSTPKSVGTTSADDSSDDTPTRSRRARKEKKIFDL